MSAGIRLSTAALGFQSIEITEIALEHRVSSIAELKRAVPISGMTG